MKEFRLLRADEIDVRASRIIKTRNGYGVALLLYKDARCDMNILDESVGPLNWQRHHSRDNANCIVSIWDSDKNQWIEKEDTGTESNTEAAKGLASDSFKRACVNLGIGRELYTSPKQMTFWDSEANFNGGKCYDKFIVTEIKYQGRCIESVTVFDIDTGKSKTFTQEVKVVEDVTKEQKEDKKKTEDIGKMKIAPVKANALISKCATEGVSVEKLLKLYKVGIPTDLTEAMYRNINDNWEKVKESCGV